MGPDETKRDEPKADEITPNDYSGLGIPNLDVIEVDPGACRPARWNAEVYERLLDGDDPLYASGDSIEALVEGIRLIGGNSEPGLVLDSGDGTYEIVTGHRRCRACAEAGLPFHTRILPADVPEDVVLKIFVESNATQRVRSPIHRLREARLQEPRIRAMLDARKKAGVKLSPDEKNETFNAYAAAHFFGDQIKALTVEKLIQVVRLAEGDQESKLYKTALDAAEVGIRRGEIDVPETDPPEHVVARWVAEVIEEARGHVVSIHKGDMTPGEAYRLLDKTPVDRRRSRSARRAKKRGRGRARRPCPLPRVAGGGAPPRPRRSD